MESTIGHIYLYVPEPEKIYPFYKNLLEYLGYKEHANKKWGFSFGKGETSIWFERTPKDGIQEYKRRNTGLNHIAFRVNSPDDVDKFYKEILKPNKVTILYETPKSFKNYGHGYYAVFFEDPTGLKLEVCYHG